MNFAPHDYQRKLKQIGFELLAEFVDYVNLDLEGTSVASCDPDHLEFLKEADCEEVSLLSKRCAGQSRGFSGEEPELFEEWIKDGNNVIVIRDQGKLPGSAVCPSMRKAPPYG